MELRIDHGGSIVKTTVVHYSLDMTREDPQMKLRMPADLRDRIAEQAKHNGRSMNSEIIARLEGSFSTPENAILLSAFERLNTELARIEIEKLSEQAQTALFAFNLRDVCERLLLHATSPEAEAELKGFIADASAVIHGASAFEDKLKQRIEALAETIRARKARPAEKSD